MCTVAAAVAPKARPQRRRAEEFAGLRVHRIGTDSASQAAQPIGAIRQFLHCAPGLILKRAPVALPHVRVQPGRVQAAVFVQPVLQEVPKPRVDVHEQPQVAFGQCGVSAHHVLVRRVAAFRQAANVGSGGVAHNAGVQAPAALQHIFTGEPVGLYDVLDHKRCQRRPVKLHFALAFLATLEVQVSVAGSDSFGSALGVFDQLVAVVFAFFAQGDQCLLLRVRPQVLGLDGLGVL